MASCKELTNGTALIFSAPSGCGKTTIINRLRVKNPQLGFSVSATSRAPRAGEENGREYYFLSQQEFRERIAQGDFLEWQEVYSGTLYGTLREEALNVKRELGDAALTIFIAPPSLDVLRERLENRGTESPESIKKRLARAEEEIGYASRFDITIVNDVLDIAVEEAQRAIHPFLAF